MWKRLSVIWLAVRGDAKRLWYALGHPESPGWLKAGTVALVLYLVSPIDLIPDFIPVLGWIDDLVIVPMLVSWITSLLPANRQQTPDATPPRSDSGPVIDGNYRRR